MRENPRKNKLRDTRKKTAAEVSSSGDSEGWAGFEARLFWGERGVSREEAGGGRRDAGGG